MMAKPIVSYLLPILLLGFFVLPAEAATTLRRTAGFSIGQGGSVHNVFGGTFQGGASVDSADVNGDGQDDIIVGAGESGGPQVEVYTQAGTRIGSFFTFKSTMKSGLSVAAGDLTGEGVAEIVVGPRGNYQPEVQVYDITGRRLASFLAFESSYTGGIDLTVLDKQNGAGGIILVAAGSGRDQEVRGFTMRGVKLFEGWYPHGRKPNNGLSLAAYWSTTYGEPVLVTGSGAGEKPLVLIHGLNSGQLLASWRPYALVVTSGIDVDAEQDLIVTGPGRKSGPEVRVFNLARQIQQQYLAFDPQFIGGIEVALTTVNGMLTPIATPSGKQSGVDTPVAGKVIKIDLSDQRLQMIENGRVISTRTVSTGQWSTPTPVGTYQTRNKISVAYSKQYDLYMEYWMAFSADGAYGLHALPFWKTAGGGKYYEGLNHLGSPVSHGCIRQSLADAKSLYSWAPVGTTVVIQK